jgi:HPt (histidine-containing phosphotransfer) domain-containing protein
MNTAVESPPSIMSEVLDPNSLAKLSQLDPSGQNRLVQRVLSTYRQSLARLQQQIANGLDTTDLPSVRIGAHTLKSSSASIGALELSSLCAAVEQSIRDGQQDRLTILMPQLHSEIIRVDNAVSRLLAN